MDFEYKEPWWCGDRNYRSPRGDAKMAIKVKFCIKCNQGWETDVNNKKKILRHEDFPSYGIKKKFCPHCIS